MKVNSNSDSSEEENCWEIGQTCPDELSVVKVQQDKDGNLDVFCSYDWKLRLKQLMDLVQELQVFKYLTVHFKNYVESVEPTSKPNPSNSSKSRVATSGWQHLGGNSVLTGDLDPFIR